VTRIRIGIEDVNGEPELRVDELHDIPTEQSALGPVDLDEAYARLKAQLADDPDALRELADGEAESAARLRAFESAIKNRP
jgi:hypothetical protein